MSICIFVPDNALSTSVVVYVVDLSDLPDNTKSTSVFVYAADVFGFVANALVTSELLALVFTCFVMLC